MTAPAKTTPKDAQVMSNILKDMGINDYEPRVINHMLEFTYSTYFTNFSEIILLSPNSRSLGTG